MKNEKKKSPLFLKSYFKRFDSVHSIDTERERGCLARTVREQRAVQVSVFSLKKSCLISRESASNTQIQLLACVHRQRLVQVRPAQSAHGSPNVGLGDRAEVGAEYAAHVEAVHGALDCVDHLEANVLALFVTVEPEHQVVGARRLLLQEGGHPEIRRRLLLVGLGLEELGRVDLVPVVVLGGEVQAHHVAAHRRHAEFAGCVLKSATPLVYGAGVVEAFVRAHLVVGENLGDTLSQRRLFGDHENEHFAFFFLKIIIFSST